MAAKRGTGTDTIKFSYLSQVFRCSIDNSSGLSDLRKTLGTHATNLPSQYYLYYYDDQGDMISIMNDPDLEECRKFFSHCEDGTMRVYICSVNPAEDWAAKLLKKIDLASLYERSSKNYQALEKILKDIANNAELGLNVTIEAGRKLYQKVSQKLNGENSNYLFYMKAQLELVEKETVLMIGESKPVMLKLTNTGSEAWPPTAKLSFSCADKSVTMTDESNVIAGMAAGSTKQVSLAVKGTEAGKFWCFWQLDCDDAIFPVVLPFRVNVCPASGTGSGSSSCQQSDFEVI